ncbi:MAG: hypothetical protein H6509_00700 [Bryobacterales bacterium]|nr:hypothetical protein [Acidobacteriota bacterium]MCB9383103.1 hypothetical protein [Bryobacterales bacterium]
MQPQSPTPIPLFERLFWPLLWGTLLAGAGWYFAHGGPREGVFAATTTLLFGFATFCLARASLQLGRFRYRASFVYRRKEPILFWSMAVGYHVAAAILTAAGIWISIREFR